MGAVAVGRALFAGARAIGGRFFGAGPPAALTAGAPEAAVSVGRRLFAPAVAGGAGLGLGGILGSIFGGGGVNGAAAAAPMALPAARGAGGSTFVTLDDGSRVLVSPSGVVARPQLFLPAGAKLPAGATIVSISPGGDLFGVRRRRKRRSFAGEIERCKTAVKAADSLISAVRKKR